MQNIIFTGQDLHRVGSLLGTFMEWGLHSIGFIEWSLHKMGSSLNKVFIEKWRLHRTRSSQDWGFHKMFHTHNAHIFMHTHELLDYISVKMALEFCLGLHWICKSLWVM